ncbi:MAG: endonuclease G, mitochondrial [Parcubacteria group bacterium Gr01-1014_3]|nr:MAG: endonuclease G, mitochondrial [Parcubacteria group bacterium Gr01-1014_3]
MLGFLVLGSQNVLAYGVETHAFLTQAATEFYNKNFPDKKLSEETINYLIDGARLEDNSPRYMNHFYDPVNQRGLVDLNFSGMAAKDWVRDAKAQTALLYRVFPQTEASILTASALDKIKPIFHQDNFTWESAIQLYAEGKLEQAMFALGHALHLIEDMAVPDHTRNDAHPPFDHGGSPYENWSHKFDLENPDVDLAGRLKNKKPISFSGLSEYFDSMALYSNNNFYSRDSIKNYELPNPDYTKESDGRVFVYKTDKEFGDYRVAISLDDGENLWKSESLILDDAKEKSVLQDYWFRLSTKAAQHVAGAINLFFQEAEKAKKALTLEKQRRPFLGTLVDGFNQIFGGAESTSPYDVLAEIHTTTNVPEVPVPTSAKATVGKPAPTAPPKPVASVVNVIEPVVQATEPKIVPTPKIIEPIPVEIVALNLCSFGDSSVVKLPQNDKKLVINEVAWMGSVNSTSDEWIELKNISGQEIDLSGWQVLDMGDDIKAKLTGKLVPGGFYLLERTDDNSVPGVTMDQKYTGALSNVGEGLRLFNSNCDLADEAMAAPDWSAGDNSSKRTMERQADLSWRNYDGNATNGIYGTPKAQNSAGTMPFNPTGASTTSTPPPAPQVTSQPTTNNEPQPPQTQQPAIVTAGQASHLVISEILFDAVGADTNQEWIELYNPTDQAVDLSSWSIQHLSSTGSLTKKNFEAGNSVAAKSFFLIWLGGNSAGDLLWSSGSLSNTSATIYLVNSTDYISTSSPSGVDAAHYDTSALTGFSPGYSLERKAWQNDCVTASGSGEFLGNGCDTDGSASSPQADWEVRDLPAPQNKTSLPEPRSAPAAVNNFNATFSSQAMELILNWDVLPDLTYSLAEILSGSSTPLATTSVGQYKRIIAELGRDYSFEIITKDKDGLISPTTQANKNPGGFFSAVDFFQDATATGSPYLLNLTWDAYPFILKQLPSITSGQIAPNNWHAVIIYYNQEAPVTDDIFWLDLTGTEVPYRTWGLHAPNGLKIEYDNCRGSITKGASLILPDNSGACNGMAGNHASYGMNWANVGPGLHSFKVVPENFITAPVAGTDYLTFAYYAYQPGYEPNNYGLRLLATDKTRHYFK